MENLTEDKVRKLVNFLIKHDISKINIEGPEIQKLDTGEIFDFYGINPFPGLVSISLEINWGYVESAKTKNKQVNSFPLEYLRIYKGVYPQRELGNLATNVMHNIIDLYGLKWLIVKLSEVLFLKFNKIFGKKQAEAVIKRALDIPLDSTGRSHISGLRKKLVRSKKFVDHFSYLMYLDKITKDEETQINNYTNLESELKIALQHKLEKVILYDQSSERWDPVLTLADLERKKKLRKLRASSYHFWDYIKLKRKKMKLEASDLDQMIFPDFAMPEWSMFESQTEGSTFPRYDHYLKAKKILQLDNRYDKIVQEYSDLTRTYHSEISRIDLPTASLVCEVCLTINPLPKEILEPNEIVKLPEHCNQEMKITIVRGKTS